MSRKSPHTKAYDRYLLQQLVNSSIELEGVSQSAFLDALNRFGVTPFQADVDELIHDVSQLGDSRHCHPDKTKSSDPFGKRDSTGFNR